MHYHHYSFKTCLAGVLGVGLCAALSLQAQFMPPGFGGSRSRGGTSTSSTTSRQYPGNGTVGDAVISIDPDTRNLVVIADDQTTKYISQVVENLDRPKPQVLIKVVFIEVQYNNASDIGIEGGWGQQNLNGTIQAANAANVFGLGSLTSVATNQALNALGQPISSFQPVSPITSQGAGLYQILGTDYQVTLRAIAQAGKAKLLSRPSVIARNNQPATISVGQSVPLINSTRFDNFGNAINSISYQDVGINLHVTPFITSDNMVELIVSPQTSALVQDRTQWVPISSGTSGTVSAPLINNRSADTVVVTPDGATVIIGGLMQDSKAESDTKIPLLGDIPLLGNLFKRKQTTDAKTELLIFLTPHIIPGSSDFAALTAEETRKLNVRKRLTEKELDAYLDGLPTNAPPAGPSGKSKRK